MYTYIYIHVYTCMCICLCICIHIRIRIQIHTIKLNVWNVWNIIFCHITSLQNNLILNVSNESEILLYFPPIAMDILCYLWTRLLVVKDMVWMWSQFGWEHPTGRRKCCQCQALPLARKTAFPDDYDLSSAHKSLSVALF